MAPSLQGFLSTFTPLNTMLQNGPVAMAAPKETHYDDIVLFGVRIVLVDYVDVQGSHAGIGASGGI